MHPPETAWWHILTDTDGLLGRCVRRFARLLDLTCCVHLGTLPTSGDSANPENLAAVEPASVSKTVDTLMQVGKRALIAYQESMCRRIGSKLGDHSSSTETPVSPQPQHFSNLSDCASYISSMHSGPAAWAEITEAAQICINRVEHACSRKMQMAVRTAISNMHARRQLAGVAALSGGEKHHLNC